MNSIRGKYSEAVIMVDELEQSCVEQIQNICNLPFMQDSKIRIMSDAHAGKGVCVGFTAIVKDKIVPNFIGVDISCSVSAYKLEGVTKDMVDLNKLDSVIRKHVPSGMSVRVRTSKLVDSDMRDSIHDVCKEIGDERSFSRHLDSLGSTGGGNHFESLDVDSSGDIWLVIHTGSRNFGNKICKFHQSVAEKFSEYSKKETIDKILSEVEPHNREKVFNEIRENSTMTGMEFITGEDLDLYIKHVNVAKQFATTNHLVISSEIIQNMGWTVCDRIFTNHNYIEQLDDGRYLIRKGAVSAKAGERLIIPMNMQYGSLICTGLGNEHWNNSAPHGAGRILSRSQAKKQISMDEYVKSMEGIYTSCVCPGTLDESPMAYKNPEDIIGSIGDTVKIDDTIKTLYNFKANDSE